MQVCLDERNTGGKYANMRGFCFIHKNIQNAGCYTWRKQPSVMSTGQDDVESQRVVWSAAVGSTECWHRRQVVWRPAWSVAVGSTEWWHRRRAIPVQANSSLCSGKLLGTVKQCRLCWNDWTAGDTRLCANSGRNINSCQTAWSVSLPQHCDFVLAKCMQFTMLMFQSFQWGRCSAARRLFLVPQDFLWVAAGAETCSRVTFVMNCILLSVIELFDMFVVTMGGESNTAAELTNQKCHSSVTLACLLCTWCSWPKDFCPRWCINYWATNYGDGNWSRNGKFYVLEGKSKLIKWFFSKALSSEFFTWHWGKYTYRQNICRFM